MWMWIEQLKRSLNAAATTSADNEEAANTQPGTLVVDGSGRRAATTAPRARRLQKPSRHEMGQHLFALDAIQRAWLAVKRAGGCAGMDGVTIDQFEAHLGTELRELQQLLASGRYRPKPVRQVWVPKASGGLRPLTMWALRDRVAQRAVYDLLAPEFEPHFLPCSFGFRPGLGVQDAVKALQAHRDAGMRWIVDADIEDCFGKIPSDRLMGLVRQRVSDRLLLRYTRGWLDADIMNSADGRPRKTGTSQGSVLSPLLSNVYLHQVDVVMMKHELAYLRYADDFVICCRRRRDAEAAMHASEEALARWALRINPHKTRIIHLDQGLNWLGYFFVRNESYVL